MDITPLFKASIKTLKATGKFSDSVSRTNILKSTKKSEFIHNANKLAKQISSLRDFLLEHRKAYLNFSHSFVQSEQMSDFERDRIDAGAQKIINSCSELIGDLKKKIPNGNSQVVEAQVAIVGMLGAYLKTVTGIYAEQKATRVKWTLELHKLTKLEQESKSDLLLSKSSDKTEESSPETSSIRKTSPRTEDGSSASNYGELSAEELQMFEMENEQLYNDLNSLNDEVQEIQSKVVKIADLQELFTEKVLEQSEDIERVASTLVGTTENLKDANTQIRQAIQSNAGLRIYILFFLLVMSFSLLFLDWYND